MAWHATYLECETIEPWAQPITVGGEAVVIGMACGRLWAIEDRCSHAHCAFSTDGEIDGSIAVCNCHGSEFDVFTGSPLAPPAIDPINTYSVRVVGQTIEVSV
jgi:3-phenylpropionate/trans-cinnamate dioxygenase ferredoxin component